MDDRIKESISALLDNEADELELRRVLNNSDDPAMKAVWSRYSKVSGLLSSGQRLYEENTYTSMTDNEGMSERNVDQGMFTSNSLLTIDLSAKISRSIDLIENPKADVEETAIVTPSLSSLSKKGVGFVSTVTIAATIFMAVTLVFKSFDDSADVNDEVLLASNVNTVQLNERPFSPEHAQMLNQYLLRHAENSVSGGRPGLMPLARVASFTIAEN